MAGRGAAKILKFDVDSDHGDVVIELHPIDKIHQGVDQGVQQGLHRFVLVTPQQCVDPLQPELLSLHVLALENSIGVKQYPVPLADMGHIRREFQTVETAQKG